MGGAASGGWGHSFQVVFMCADELLSNHNRGWNQQSPRDQRSVLLGIMFRQDLSSSVLGWVSFTGKLLLSARSGHTHPHTHTSLLGVLFLNNSLYPNRRLADAESKKKKKSSGLIGSILDVILVLSCSRHYLFGNVWLRSSFLQTKPFSQGCAEVAEVKGGQTSVMAA